ncbi:MAG TPA: hypothetical protein VHQ47_16735 [Phycisphaerae bacterium]|nr:hypothetical protein [Phycisphaerae bacterium]
MKSALPLTLIFLFAGCAHATHRTPDLSRTPSPTPPHKSFLQQTGDAAWNVVSAPVRLVIPAKKPPKPAPQPETYEPAEAMILMPPPSNSQAPATQPR